MFNLMKLRLYINKNKYLEYFFEWILKIYGNLFIIDVNILNKRDS